MRTTADQQDLQPTSAAHAPPGPILGIDPGLQRTGYAVLTTGQRGAPCRVIEAGVIRLDPRQPIESRLVELESSLDEIISTHRPAVMACEQLYAHYKHPRTAIIMAHARGVILTLAARRGLSIVHVAATHVKKHLTGSGRAGKAQVQRAVATTLNLPQIPEPNDVADAMAVALCGLQMQREANQCSVGSPCPTTTDGKPAPRAGQSPCPTNRSVGPPRPTNRSAGSPTKGSVGSPRPTSCSAGPPHPTNRTAPTPTGARS